MQHQHVDVVLFWEVIPELGRNGAVVVAQTGNGMEIFQSVLPLNLVYFHRLLSFHSIAKMYIWRCINIGITFQWTSELVINCKKEVVWHQIWLIQILSFEFRQGKCWQCVRLCPLGRDINVVLVSIVFYQFTNKSSCKLKEPHTVSELSLGELLVLPQ